jgi:hypothetical protein
MTMKQNRWRPSALTAVVLVLVAVIGLLLGLYGSIFGPLYPFVLGLVATVVGAIVMARGIPWGRVLLTWGLAMIVGAALYVALGLLTPDGAGSGSGTGCAPGAACEAP